MTHSRLTHRIRVRKHLLWWVAYDPDQTGQENYRYRWAWTRQGVIDKWRRHFGTVRADRHSWEEIYL